jgi:subtilisin family serine protease
MAFTRTALAAGLLAVACAAAADTGSRKIYIVQLADAPAATYAGTVSGLPATRPAPGAKLDAGATNVRTYVNYLQMQHAKALSTVRGAPVVQEYSLVFNGFAAELTGVEAKALKNAAGVVSVTESEVRKLDTTRTPGFLGISAPGGIWSQFDAAARNVKGEDVIIGVIDSGVWPEDASFGDKVDAGGKPVAYTQAGTVVYGPPPVKWTGTCETGPGFTAAMCNNKLLGARFYHASFDASGAVRTSFEYLSPRDGGGHGTHTSSTAGGNANVDASIDGTGVGVMSGIAPRARLAVYKVCWEATVAAQTGCYTADTLKAIDDAVADGVDVINYSVSGTQTNFADPVEIAYLNATAAGVFVAASAGNNGPANQVAHISPWLATVAASTHDRYTVANVTLGAPSGATFSGPSYQSSGFPSTPLVRSIDVIVGSYASLPQAEKTAAERCYLPADGGTANTAIDPAKAAGKMVICYRGGNVLVNKAATVKAGGGVAMIIQNVPAIGGTPASNNTTVLQPYVIPTVHLTNSSYAAIDAYVTSTGASATASFGPGVQQAGVVAPVMADFSSRGPNKANGNILKPDITGPGVDIIAGYLDSSLTQAQHDGVVAGTFTPAANATSLQGTSMSSPHVAGAAALLKQLYPTWSPAAIKSAMMTSTTDVKLANGSTDTNRWGYGAGHMNPNGSADPGLVYDASPADYGRFMCGLGMAPPAGIGTCATLGSIKPWNLNLASLTASDVPGVLTLTRKVTNVTGAPATFTASTSLPGWNVVVSPSSLTLAAGGSGSFNVTLTRTTAAIGAWTFGSLVWSDGVRQVRSPLSARAIGFVAPAQVSDTRVAGNGTKVFTVTSAYTGTLSAVATGLVPATRSAGSVLPGAKQCFDFAVAANAQFARFQLFNSDTLGGSATDLDLDVFNGPGGTGVNVGSSGGSTSDEVVTVKTPSAGTYSACVTGFATPVTGATFTMSSWTVGPATGPQTLQAAGPATVYAGGTSVIGLGWSVQAGQRYMGNVQFFDGTSALIGSTVVFIDNH